MKKLFSALIFWALAASTAFAQVGVVPSTGLTTGYLYRSTYSAAFIGLVPAASATDLVCIAGASAKTIRLMQVRLSGSAGTAVGLPVTILRRGTLDSGGTAATTTANPANTISKRNPNNATATATLISYTANPTINDASPTYIASAQVNLPTTAAGSGSVPALFDFSKDVENFVEPPTLLAGATTQQICVNLNAVSVTSGLITGEVTWTEE